MDVILVIAVRGCSFWCWPSLSCVPPEGPSVRRSCGSAKRVRNRPPPSVAAGAMTTAVVVAALPFAGATVGVDRRRRAELPWRAQRARRERADRDDVPHQRRAPRTRPRPAGRQRAAGPRGAAPRRRHGRARVLLALLAERQLVHRPPAPRRLRAPVRAGRAARRSRGAAAPSGRPPRGSRGGCTARRTGAILLSPSFREAGVGIATGSPAPRHAARDVRRARRSGADRC